MIISHKHKFIFIHCRKVAGSSIKVALAPYLGEQDIIIGSLNEIMDSGVKLNLASKKTLQKPKSISYAAAALLMGKSWHEAVNIGVKAYYRNRLSPDPPHPTAFDASKYFPYEWENYFKFAFVRNPYEKVVSDYLWRSRATNQNISFLEYLKLLDLKDDKNGIVHSGGISNFEMISIGGSIVIDIVGRYEKLDEDFAKIANKVGLSNIKLEQKQKENPANKEYSRYYGKEEIRLVSEMFADEISVFNYKFPY